jgi:hypothetical protein
MTETIRSATEKLAILGHESVNARAGRPARELIQRSQNRAAAIF